jgi:hypothetical protein
MELASSCITQSIVCALYSHPRVIRTSDVLPRSGGVNFFQGAPTYYDIRRLSGRRFPLV